MRDRVRALHESENSPLLCSIAEASPTGTSPTIRGPCHAAERYFRKTAEGCTRGRCFSISELVSLAEFVSSIAVLATLVVRVFQVRGRSGGDREPGPARDQATKQRDVVSTAPELRSPRYPCQGAAGLWRSGGSR